MRAPSSTLVSWSSPVSHKALVLASIAMVERTPPGTVALAFDHQQALILNRGLTSDPVPGLDNDRWVTTHQRSVDAEGTAGWYSNRATVSVRIKPFGDLTTANTFADRPAASSQRGMESSEGREPPGLRMQVTFADCSSTGRRAKRPRGTCVSRG
jgi:hypothetical protein